MPEPDGLWQITVSASAWLDLVVGGAALAPIAFTGVHACPGLHQSLRFRVPAGEVVLKISDADAPEIGLLAERIAP